MNLQVHAVQFSADQKLIELIEKKSEKLTQFFDKIMGVDVYLKLDNKSSQVKEKVVSVKVTIPGNQLFAEESSKMFEEAVDLSIDSIRRQLKKHKQKQRG